MEFILTRPGYHGSPAAAAGLPYDEYNIVEWRYNKGYSSSEQSIFPEDLLVMINPITPLSRFVWSGVGSGGGCGHSGMLSSDTGGTHDVTLARACGQVGAWDDAYMPVYYREGTCYKQGTLLGACAGVLNTGTADFNLQQSDFVNGSLYHHYLSPTGGELHTDPVTGGTICTAANCNGVFSITAFTWPLHLPSCTPPSSDPGTYLDAYDCAAILLP
jgi:hypothetical protein